MVVEELKVLKEPKKKLPVIIGAVAVVLAVLLGLAFCMPFGNFDQDLVAVKTVYQAYTGDTLLEYYSHIAKTDDSDLGTAISISDIDGNYDVTRDINDSLENYGEYEWDSDWLKESFYIVRVLLSGGLGSI